MMLRTSSPSSVFCGASLLVLSSWLQAQEKAPTFSSIDWKKGPCTGKLANVAQVSVPEGLLFTESRGAKQFLELTHNIPGGNEVGVLVSTAKDADYFVLFTYRDVGYVTDTDRDKLDAAALLKGIREGTEAANKVRREKGWSTMEIVGWKHQPFYDPITNNLTWAIEGRSTPPTGSRDGAQHLTVNHSVRLLGRGGYMEVDLILDPEDLDRNLPQFSKMLTGVSFTSGNRYAEFRQGDKLAGYGLTALVAGGAGALAVKSGILPKIWKLLVGLLIAVGAFFRRIWAAITGRRREVASAETPPVQPG